MHSAYFATANETILIVDDKPDNLRLLSAVLTEQRYEIRRALNGATGLRAANAAPPDLILLDVRLPDMDGYNVCQQLKQSPLTRDIPVIFLSALDDTSYKVRAFEVGGVDYITKPFHMQEVLARVENQLTIQRQKGQLRQQMERERVLGAIAQRIRESLNLNEILHTTAAEIQSILAVERVIIGRFLPQGQLSIIAEAVQEPTQALLGIALSEDLFSEAEYALFRGGNIRILESARTPYITPMHAHLLETIGIKSKLVAPILQQDHLWGMISAHQCGQQRDWTELDLRLLRQLATQLGIATQQAELYEQVQQLNINLEVQVQERTQQLQTAYELEATLTRIIEKVRDSLDEGQIMQTVVQELAIALNLLSCNASIYNLEQRTSTICFEHTTLAYSAQGHVSQMEAYPEIYDRLLQRQPIQLCSCRPNPLRGTVAVLAQPIFDEQGILGDLWLIQDKGYMFTPQDMRLVEQVASQCAIALRQSRLYCEVQRQVEELARLNQLKDDFLNTVSHELRTPMANIKTAAQMLETLFDRLSAPESDTRAIQQYLHIMAEGHQQEMKLIDTLLDLSRLDAETDPLALCTIDPAIWVPHLTEPFLDRIHSQQQTLHINVAENLPPLTTDLVYLERVVIELLNNAYKYTPPTKPSRYPFIK